MKNKLRFIFGHSKSTHSPSGESRLSKLQKSLSRLYQTDICHGNFDRYITKFSIQERNNRERKNSYIR